jgi:hypothetical protein
MTTLDLHPEELFDKAARGLLTAAEQALLDAHLSRCALCRFERQVTADFGALPRPALDVDRLVTNALTARSSQSLRPRSRRGAMLLAAAVALGAMGSFAAVGQWTGVLPRLVSALSAPPAVAPPPEAAASLLPLDPPSPPPLVEAPPAPPPPSAESLRPFPVRTLDRRPLAREAAREPPPPVPQERASDPAGLFALATGARLGGDRALAVARYRQLLAGFPASFEAAQTRASLGRLLLDDGSPAAAMELLDGYLRGPDGTLREEVMATRAQALSRLGRATDEVRAWQAMVEEYPDSVHATRARARLGSLSAPPP